MPRTMLNDELWAKLSAILRQNGLYAKQSTRLNIEGILYRMRTGCPWRDLPAVSGKHNTVYCAFNRWSAKGIPRLIHKEPCEQADCEWVFMDGSYVKAHQHAHGAASDDDEAIGLSRGGQTSKIHMLVDACGNPVHFELGPGNIADVTVAPELLKNMDLKSCDVLSADKGYDCDSLREEIERHDTKANIPYRKPRESKNGRMDWYLYGVRHLVENVFARLKHFRAIATRYDKLKRNFHSMVTWGCIVIWLPL